MIKQSIKYSLLEDLDKMRKLISAYRKSGYDDDGIKEEISYLLQRFSFILLVDGLLVHKLVWESEFYPSLLV